MSALSRPRLRLASCVENRRAALLLFVAIVTVVAVLLAAASGFAAQGISGAVSAVAILVYHRFSDTADDSMTVRVATFEAHLRFLRESPRRRRARPGQFRALR